MWGPIDLVSATTGEMRKRYGFIYVNKHDDGTGDLARSPKDSFYWYKKLIETNGRSCDKILVTALFSEQTMFKKQLIREISRNFIKNLKTSGTDRSTLAPTLLCFLANFEFLIILEADSFYSNLFSIRCFPSSLDQ